MDNSLAKVHPELVCEWSDRNLPLTPDMVTYGSNKLMWWKAACGHEWQTSVIRLLIKGYEPKEKPDERFYDVMRELSSIGNNINQLAAKANTLGFIDAPQLKKEAERWNKFQSEVERHYLRPDKSGMKWQ